MLDVSASNMGILVPRVNLVSNTLDLNADGDNNVRNQPQGLLVYNIGTVLGKGYYFWNGSEWMAFDSSTAVLPVFDALACASTTLSPAGYTTGVSYIGNLRVPYRGGNGGPYQPGAPITVNGLTFTLRAGKLEYGEGELVFSVTGIPDSLLDFNVALTNAEITFLAAEQKCTATVKNQTSADIKNLVFAGPLVYTTDNERGGYHFVATSPDGKWSVRCFLPEGSNFSQANLQLRYNGSNADPASKDIISNTTYFYGPGHTTQNNQVRYPKNQWAGRDGTSNDLVIATGQTSKNFPSWHNPGV
ncbi:hypothetical protein [Chryseobacterium sp.]|uniref:hypothetical protein n=1 Tax=Chryseobacterium sp. TaxID=1871047 RepID=UPI0028969660|nr:hypothetical protein [Chryseobacterium sp.]